MGLAGPEVLLLAQAIAVGSARSGVPPRPSPRRLAHAALGLALAYLLYPATQWLVLDDFHPVALATPLLLAAWDFLDAGQLAAFALAAAPRA